MLAADILEDLPFRWRQPDPRPGQRDGGNPAAGALSSTALWQNCAMRVGSVVCRNLIGNDVTALEMAGCSIDAAGG
jgi:hypothetical protein